MLEGVAAAVFDTIDPKGSIEVALLMRRTGTMLGAWARDDVPLEVVSVMAATMMGSIETMSEALGCPSPERVSVETDHCRMLAEKFDPYGILVLVAAKEASPEALQLASRRTLDRLATASGGGPKHRPTVPARP